ncbi:hypothetical protein EVA_15941 [gut metagenome]|uniref:Uncharacterized protein n=1 Tax=gut metagenome TaxID=749906 RepID=J9C7W6_9ZZZZ
MIITNGTIEFKRKLQAGDIDPETGYPIIPKEYWSEPQPCNIALIKENLLAVSALGSNYRERTYSVCVEADTPILSEEIRLVRDDGDILGEYAVIQIEPLDAVGIIRLTV